VISDVLFSNSYGDVSTPLAAGVDSSTPDGPLESELIALIRGINWEPDQAAFAEQVLRQMFERTRR
jgi:hypothetical protein